MVFATILNRWRFACIAIIFVCTTMIMTIPALATEDGLVDNPQDSVALVTRDSNPAKSDATATEKAKDVSADDVKDDGQDVADKTDQDVTGNDKDESSIPQPKYEDAHTNMYRVYNPNSGEHFYTASIDEATHVASLGWRWEGIGWVAPLKGEPVYRLYNPNAGDHHYTLSDDERKHLVSVGWKFEGIGWYSDGKDQSAVLRQYNPNATSGAHNFTVSKAENDHLHSVGWKPEGIGWYATNGPTLSIQGRWIITSAWGTLERYWLASDGNIAKNRLVKPDEGAGYVAFATPKGHVVRGKWDNGAGYVYVADNDGKLASTSDGKTGWLITARYDGRPERYYYDADKHAMRTSLFAIDGKQYFGQGGIGYVARNTAFTFGGSSYYADNDGVLSKARTEREITLARAMQELAACTNPTMSASEKLRAAFNHIRDDFREHNPRIPHMKQLGWETIYANDIFVGRGGNCFSYGAAMAFMAKAIGYTNVYACNSGGHGWAEVDGLVYDPEWEKNNSGRSFFGVNYATCSSPNYKVVLGGADWMRVAI